MPITSPSPCTPAAAGNALPGGVPQRCLLLTVWSTGPGAFSARAVQPDGSWLDFTSPFELARFLGSPVAAPGTRPGAGVSGLR